MARGFPVRKVELRCAACKEATVVRRLFVTVWPCWYRKDVVEHCTRASVVLENAKLQFFIRWIYPAEGPLGCDPRSEASWSEACPEHPVET